MNKDHKDPKEFELDQATSCIIQAEEVEKTPGYGLLGRYTVCSTKRIEVPSNKIERNHPLPYTPSLLYLESCCDGFWRNHIRESSCITSTPPTISFEDNWMKQLDSEVAGSSKDTHRIQPKPKTRGWT